MFILPQLLRYTAFLGDLLEGLSHNQMSLKRPYALVSQGSQSPGFTNEDFYAAEILSNMPSQRRRTNPKKKMMIVSKSRVPRAIRSRGTPDGYYEIPVTIYHRCYFNSSTGIWPTDPITGAQSGATGYNGFGMCTDLDNSIINFGTGGVAAQSFATIPGFAQLAAVFDECKIARIHYEMWVDGTAASVGSTLFAAPNTFVVVDNNNADSPANLAEILQYHPVHTVKGDINNSLKVTVYPHVRVSVGTGEQEVSTSTSIAQVSRAGYMECSKPAVTHFGLRGYFETTPALAAAQLGYLCIKETQIRRYKRQK